MELMWVNLTGAINGLEWTDDIAYGLSSFNQSEPESTWLENTLVDQLVNGTGIRGVEDSLGYISSMAYALLAQSWRAEQAQGGIAAENLSQIWIPQNVTLHGTQSVLYTQLKIGDLQLVITLLSTAVLVIASFASTYGHAAAHTDPIIRDGGVIDLLSMIADSALPAIIAGDAPDLEEGEDERMIRARQTLVAHSLGSLDVPEMLQRRVKDAVTDDMLTQCTSITSETTLTTTLV